MKFMNIEFIPLMLVPSFILLYLVLTNKSMIERIFENRILQKLKIDQGLSKQFRVTLLFMALFTMILAMARPVYQKGVVELESYNGDVVVALDLSLSMKAKDYFPNRLEFAKKKIEEFIKEADGFRIALVGFAADAFIVSPLTSDKDALLYLLDRLDTKSLSLKGTNIEAALMSANLLFGKTPSKNIVLFTDGGDAKDFSQAIEFAKKHHLKVSIIGVAGKKGVPIEADGKFLTDSKGHIAITQLNRHIQKLAMATGGIFEQARLDKSDIKELLAFLDKSKKSKKIQKVVQTTELYPYLLIFSVLFLFMSFFTIPGRLAFVLLFAVQMQLHAGLSDFKLIKEAKEAYNRGVYKQASKHFELIAKEKGSPQSYYDAGNAFYKAGEYKKAIEYYSKVQTDDKELEFRKLHNLGNSYFKLKQYKKAIQMYEKALKLKEDPDTKYNLELAKKMLKKSPKDRNQQKKQQKQQKRKPQQKNRSNKNTSGQKSRKNKSQKGSKKQQTHKQNSSKQEPISSREEKKWIKLIQQNRSKTLLYKAPINIKGTNENPW